MHTRYSDLIFHLKTFMICEVNGDIVLLAWEIPTNARKLPTRYLMLQIFFIFLKNMFLFYKSNMSLNPFLYSLD